jgi:hypothetical protein
MRPELEAQARQAGIHRPVAGIGSRSRLMISNALVGLVVLTVFAELYGWTYAGLVVPGYLAAVGSQQAHGYCRDEASERKDGELVHLSPPLFVARQT